MTTYPYPPTRVWETRITDFTDADKAALGLPQYVPNHAIKYHSVIDEAHRARSLQLTHASPRAWDIKYVAMKTPHIPRDSEQLANFINEILVKYKVAEAMAPLPPQMFKPKEIPLVGFPMGPEDFRSAK